MPRSRSLTGKKHKKIKKEARGFRDARRKRIKNAKESLLHAGQYAYIGRKLRKRDLRKLWIIRLNAAAREHGMNYNTFISKLKKGNIEIDRKILAVIAATDPDTVSELVDSISS